MDASAQKQVAKHCLTLLHYRTLTCAGHSRALSWDTLLRQKNSCATFTLVEHCCGTLAKHSWGTVLCSARASSLQNELIAQDIRRSKSHAPSLQNEIFARDILQKVKWEASSERQAVLPRRFATPAPESHIRDVPATFTPSKRRNLTIPCAGHAQYCACHDTLLHYFFVSSRAWHGFDAF